MVSRETRLRTGLSGLVVVALFLVGYAVVLGDLLFGVLGTTLGVGAVLVVARGERYVAPTMLSTAAVATLGALVEGVTAGVTTITALFALLAAAAWWRGLQYWRADRST